MEKEAFEPAACMGAYDLSVSDWRNLLASWNEKLFYAGSIFRWIHQRRAEGFNDMSDLPLKLREKLEEACCLELPSIEKMQEAKDGTRKYLLLLKDNKAIECVLMKYRFGFSLCISSQAGCRMGCRFCASTLGGLERNLTSGEMLSQIYAVEKAAKVTISHVVVMGCGEPFDNWDQLMRFLETVHKKEGKGLSYRNITVSTCGLPDKIRAFADSGLPVTLAISLHAPCDEIRSRIMRITRAVTMEELMGACRYYIEKTNRRITFEYLLIDHVNDGRKEALMLADLLERLLCHVNVIPVNPVKECGFLRPSEERIETFIHTLEDRHIPVTRRREMGKSIDAACGQLRLVSQEKRSRDGEKS